MRKGNQEQICVKLDQSSLAHLEMESGVSGLPRNRIINRAIIVYSQAVDLARGLSAGVYKEDQVAAWFLKVLVPRLLNWNIVNHELKSLEGGE